LASSNIRRVCSPSDLCSESVNESHSLRSAAKKSAPINVNGAGQLANRIDDGMDDIIPNGSASPS